MERKRDTHDTPPANRLPTISASQALQHLDQGSGKWTPTGLPRLDHALKGPSLVVLPSQSNATGGFPKGQITEIYGPPGVGKTALGLQAAVAALGQESHVAWIGMLPVSRGIVAHRLDANKPLYGPRLASLFPATASKDILRNFHHYTTPSLPHLLALVCHPPPSFPPAGTTILIIDGLSTLFTQTYPDNAAATLRSRKKTSDEAWAVSQRYAVMADLLAKLTKLAAIRDLAIVLLSHTSIKVNPEFGAVLRPAIWTKSWTEGVPNRIIIFRDFYRTATGERRSDVRFVSVTKLNGVLRNRLDVAVAFQIGNNGCTQIESQEVLPAPSIVPMNDRPPRKRKREQEEVADSQSDISDDDLLLLLEHGLDDDDEETVQMQTSFAETREFEHDLAAFETTIDDGLDDV